MSCTLLSVRRLGRRLARRRQHQRSGSRHSRAAEIQCIGATTPGEFRKSIEKDRSLERRFQAVKVPPPTESDAVKIMYGIKDRYEKFPCGELYR